MSLCFINAAIWRPGFLSGAKGFDIFSTFCQNLRGISSSSEIRKCFLLIVARKSMYIHVVSRSERGKNTVNSPLKVQFTESAHCCAFIWEAELKSFLTVHIYINMIGILQCIYWWNFLSSGFGIWKKEVRHYRVCTLNGEFMVDVLMGFCLCIRCASRENRP